MATVDTMLENLIESQVESLIQDDSYYQMFATPLKPASAFKNAHKKQLIEFFKLTELRSQLENAPDLILTLMPQYLSQPEMDKIKTELDNSGDHFLKFVESMKETEKPILFQEMFGLSDDTLLKVYDLGVNLVKQGYYEDANTLFVFLATLAPHVASYWIAQGACLQALDRQEEAVAVFNAAKFLNPSDPAPCAYSIESYQILKDQDKAKLELSLLKEIVKSLKNEEKTKWEQKINEIKI